jgi:fused signal recognition particle receptor
MVIVDTAGRLQTKINLMEQLKKIKRTISKNLPDAPHDVLLVLDATTGQNALSQAKLFHEGIGITGIILTKLDGTAKGGIVLGICHTLGIPIRYIGIGEGIEDLQEFDAKLFIDALL